MTFRHTLLITLRLNGYAFPMEVEKPNLTPPRQDTFGDEEHAEVKQGGLLIVTETILLGILSLPAAIASLGLVPGLIVLIGLGLLACYTGYMIRYVADASKVLMGRFGRELFGIAQLLFLVFIMASHILTFTVALNKITGHTTCSIVFGVVSIILSILFIFSAIMIVMIALGVQNPGSAVKATIKTNLVTGFTAAVNIAFLYDIVPLGSAGPLISRIAYGVALPTIVIAGVINSHVAAKSIYIRIFAGTDRMHKSDFVAVGTWVRLTVCLWIVAWIIAEVIPVFNSLLTLILYINKGLWFSSPKKIALTLLNNFAIYVSIVLCGLGLYTSGKSIYDNLGSASFSCANNT
ncbi:hypothetical protein PMG11_04386 [Penicillium brasilianum]|uniref:Amino acid transporter transmembrane domain-containing protein n=1 Tax=Penicillium brasilianum TaxID=104259 RepID=A0A0F7VFZ2_PENBI|nr:hypothetical protein PMG11_04386 [Penicillium brasilianum]